MNKFIDILMCCILSVLTIVTFFIVSFVIYGLFTGEMRSKPFEPTPQMVECSCECQGGTAEDLLIIDTEYKVEWHAYL